MVYLYKKIIGNQPYYYLRASVQKNGKTITKDIKYLGNDLAKLSDRLNDLPKKYADEIRKAHKTIQKFLDTNHFLEKAKSLKLKSDSYLRKESVEQLEACRLHWQERVLKLDNLTREEALKNFVIEFAFNTASLEGNTITLKEAQNLLLENRTPKDKTLREIHDVQNTEKVFMKLFKGQPRAVDHKLIIEIHDALLENIDARKGYRQTDVRVFRATFKSTPAPYVKADMDILLRWYNNNKSVLHPFVLASIFHHKFERIHPFMDGNGRTGRMLLNYILLRNGQPPLIIRKKNRLDYLERLHKADACELTKNTPGYYAQLTEFNAKEQAEMYWDIFL